MNVISLPTLVRELRATLSVGQLRARFTLWSGYDTAARWARRLMPFVASAVGLWLCVRVFTGLDWHAVAHDLRHVGVGAALLLLAPIVSNFVHMVGWRALLPSKARPDLKRSFAIFLAAQAGNDLGLGVLGESLKVSELPRDQRSVALRAMLLDNASALAALFAVVLSMAAFLGGVAASYAVPRSASITALSVLALALLGLAAWERSGHSSSPGLLAAFLAHYLGKLWIVAEFGLALALLGSVTLRSSTLLGLVSTLASAAGAAIPGQLGVLEAALKGSAASCGLAACTLVSVALLRRARSVLWIALGALLFWQLRAQRAPAAAAAPI